MTAGLEAVISRARSARRDLLLIAAVLLAAACDGGGQATLAAEALPLPSDTLVAPWTNLPVAAWVGGGRWAVVAGDWDAAVIADFGRRTIEPLGGAKQQAYLHPVAVFAVGDTVYLADWGRRRTTVWTAEGKLLDSIPSPDALRGGYPRGRDAAGQLYFEVPPIPGRDGSGNQDSAAIVRAPRSLARFDTVARLAPAEVAEMRRENSRRFEKRALSGSDLWGVWPDGTVWIARLSHNHLESVDPARHRTSGPSLPDPVFEVTQADRDRYLQGFPTDVRPNETDLAFALVHPPFVGAFAAPAGAGGSGAGAPPGGGPSIWLEKSKPVLDSVRKIHVLDRSGNLRRVLELHGEARMLGVGDRTILVAEQFEKGIRLMQVRIPAEPGNTPG
jgi:hypothetical protein